MTEKQFNFGENWREFSHHALTPERVEQAREDFADLFRGIPLRDRSFLDIGFGQALSLLIATAAGTRSVGCDINPICAEILAENRQRFFPELANAQIPVVVGSILDEEVLAGLRSLTGEAGRETYDVVHSWGVLHHTGDMWRGIQHAASLVGPEGHLILALYAHHWSSGVWKLIKWSYVRVPSVVRRLFIALLYPVIYLAKFLVTRRDPREQKRGMDFYYDVVDWVGGYPYEYVKAEELVRQVEELGFKNTRMSRATVPTGCNEFVFARTRPVSSPDGR